MDAGLLRRSGVDPHRPRTARVQGMAPHIGRQATLIPSPEGVVFGIVTELSHADIDRLYSRDRVGAYRPEPVLARPEDGSAVPALCFNLPDSPPSAERDPRYARRLAELGRGLGFPAGYPRTLE